MDATPHTAALKQVHGWNIHLTEQHDLVAKWHASATNIVDGKLVHVSANGMSQESALTRVAEKAKISPSDVLKTFEL